MASDIVDGLVEIEWIGDPPILDDAMRIKIAARQIPRSAVAILRQAENKRMKAIAGCTKRIVTPDSFPGLSGELVFGPNVFTKLVSTKDLDIIMGSNVGYQFKLVRRDDPEIILPATDVTLVEAEDFANGASLKQAYW